MFKIYDGKEDFTQWDINQKIIVEDSTIKEVHFNNALSANALVCVPYELDGLLVVDVPNILLQEALRLYVYAFCGECVRASADYEVKPRVKPSDYVYTETEVKTYAALDNRLTEVEADLTETANELNLAIGNKADKEEWVIIADTTTIEGVREVIADKDINGNPFECKRVIFYVYLPTHAAQDFSMGVSCGNARYIPCTIDAEKGQAMFEFEVVKDVFCSCSYHCTMLNDGLYGRYETSQKKIFADSSFCTDNFKFVNIWAGGDGVFPVGTQIKIWGVKA